MNVRSSTTTGSPQRREDSARHDAVESTCERIGFDRYVVLHDGPVGYIEAVSTLFVCYLGHPYPRAVEIAQVYDFDHAVRIVSAMAAGSRDHALAG